MLIINRKSRRKIAKVGYEDTNSGGVDTAKESGKRPNPIR